MVQRATWTGRSSPSAPRAWRTSSSGISSTRATARPSANIWFGVDRRRTGHAAERIADLLDIPAAVRFLSCEPLLGPLDLSEWLLPDRRTRTVSTRQTAADWVIAGGESGPQRRPFDPAWACSLRDQCKAADIPFFYKQGSAFRPGQDDLLDGLGLETIPGGVLTMSTAIICPHHRPGARHLHRRRPPAIRCARLSPPVSTSRRRIGTDKKAGAA